MCRKFAIKGFKANLFGEKQKVSLYIILYFFFLHISLVSKGYYGLLSKEYDIHTVSDT